MIRGRRTYARASTFGLVVLLAAAALHVAPALAQDRRGKASSSEPAKGREFHVFQLKHARAREMVNLLGGLFPGEASIAMDERTNAVLVSGQPSEIEKVQALIAKLDVEAEGNAPLPARLKVYHLGSVEPTPSLASSLEMLLKPRAGNFALDEQRRVAIVSADDVALKAVEELLRTLDRPAPRAPVVDVKVRVLWLVNNLKGQEGAPPPDDLKDVLSGLAKLGIDRPRVVAQTLVNATVGTQFQAQGVANLNSAICPLTVSGRLGVKGDTPTLDISLSARQPRGREAGEISLCDLHTQITAPLGHFVVLGMTPMDAMTSVFVVQVLKPEGQGQRP